MTDIHAPKDELVRAVVRGGYELRARDDGKPPTMVGHFTKWDSWYEVDSLWEGNFLERTAPGSARKTINENMGDVRSLFNHGMDPSIGDKPMGPVEVLREDEIGGYYEVPLLDARYVREDILPGLEAGLYGSSFRFKVTREEWVDDPKASDYNPDRKAERTIKEFRLYEFGPVTFPANPAATATVRSATDDYLIDRLARDPERLRALVERHQGVAPSADAGPLPTSEERREAPVTPASPVITPPSRRFRSREEFLTWIDKT
jgi:HK97 family phage prohead protease